MKKVCRKKTLYFSLCNILISNAYRNITTMFFLFSTLGWTVLLWHRILQFNRNNVFPAGKNVCVLLKPIMIKHRYTLILLLLRLKHCFIRKVIHPIYKIPCLVICNGSPKIIILILKQKQTNKQTKKARVYSLKREGKLRTPKEILIQAGKSLIML